MSEELTPEAFEKKQNKRLLFALLCIAGAITLGLVGYRLFVARSIVVERPQLESRLSDLSTQRENLKLQYINQDGVWQGRIEEAQKTKNDSLVRNYVQQRQQLQYNYINLDGQLQGRMDEAQRMLGDTAKAK